MPKFLDDEVKRFIVIQLAMRRRPSQVVVDAKEAFGVDVSKQQVQAYDPTTANGRRLSEGLRDLFYRERQAYEERVNAGARAYTREALQEELAEALDTIEDALCRRGAAAAALAAVERARTAVARFAG